MDDPGTATAPPPTRRGAPLYEVTLWPNRSLSPQGLRLVVAGAAAVLALPLLWAFGTRALWFVAPFAALDLLLLWVFLARSTRNLQLTETLRLWPDLVTVERREPSGRVLTWEANPYWVQLALHPEGRVENYLTLRGGGREIELGAFLAPEERLALRADLDSAFARARAAGPAS